MNNEKKYRLVLGSQSPRRQELIKGLEMPFEVRTQPNLDETIPAHLPTDQVAEYLAKHKADQMMATLALDELLITADTIVVIDDVVLGKPKNRTDAMRMLSVLSGRTHQVITGVALTSSNRQDSFSAVTDVTFALLTDDVIKHYVDRYKPFDKAGAYGIQEWIGYVGIERIEGSYYNVMGLPLYQLNEALQVFFSQ